MGNSKTNIERVNILEVAIPSYNIYKVMSSPPFIFTLGFEVKMISSSFSYFTLSFLLTFHIAIPFQLPYCQIPFLILGISAVNIFSKTLHYSICLDSLKDPM